MRATKESWVPLIVQPWVPGELVGRMEIAEQVLGEQPLFLSCPPFSCFPSLFLSLPPGGFPVLPALC